MKFGPSLPKIAKVNETSIFYFNIKNSKNKKDVKLMIFSDKNNKFYCLYKYDAWTSNFINAKQWTFPIPIPFYGFGSDFIVMFF